jgi:hypothetical protein
VINDRKSGVPTSEDDEELHFHIWFTLEKHIEPLEILRSYCVLTRKIEPTRVKIIS